jgi:hypothetical protein
MQQAACHDISLYISITYTEEPTPLRATYAGLAAKFADRRAALCLPSASVMI